MSVLWRIISKSYLQSVHPCRLLLTLIRHCQSGRGRGDYTNNMEFKYPSIRRDESIIDVYHGCKIPDPYRWLEDPDSEETKNFIKTQNDVTIPYLNGCEYREDVRTRLEQLWDYEKFSCPQRQGNRYFYYRNSGLQNQNVLYVQDTLDSRPREFFDPNTLSEDGTIALTDGRFSEDGTMFAYALSQSGSDWMSIHFMDVETGKQLPDVLTKVKFSPLTWTHDNVGIFYACYPHAKKADGADISGMGHQKLFYHRIGTTQADDVLVVEFPNDPQMIIIGEVSDDGRYLILTPQRGTKNNLLYFHDLQKSKGEITGLLELTQLVFELVADYEYVTTEGSENIFRTNKDAANYRLIAIDFDQPKTEWRTVIAEEKRDVLSWASPVNNDHLVVCYIHNVVSLLSLHKITGEKLFDFPLDLGTVIGFSGKKKYTDIFYQFISFLTPGIIYYCDLAQSTEVHVFKRTVLVGCEDWSSYSVKQVFYPSSDRCLIPMFIIFDKNVIADSGQPCLLYGYGGFSISVQPSFSVARLVFIQHLRGVCAVANIRGGGEYGDKWHNAGRHYNKQNCFNDFQSAAEYLICEGYTSHKMLTIQGASNGGLLVAACINQRPDLFGAAIVQVGVLDMLRYHKFTIGYAWGTDYGYADDEPMFHNLFQYSPLHNTHVPRRPGSSVGVGGGMGQYPATLLLTADHDDRVVPLHSFKFIAQLQHAVMASCVQVNPVMIRVECKAGHGRGKPTTKLIDEATDILCFIIRALNLKFVPQK